MLSMAERGQRYGPSGKQRPLEAAYQDEFYRSFIEELGTNECIASEQSYCPPSVKDASTSPRWGIELLRDGDKPAEHLKRFEPGVI